MLAQTVCVPVKFRELSESDRKKRKKQEPGIPGLFPHLFHFIISRNGLFDYAMHKRHHELPVIGVILVGEIIFPVAEGHHQRYIKRPGRMQVVQPAFQRDDLRNLLGHGFKPAFHFGGVGRVRNPIQNKMSEHKKLLFLFIVPQE